MFEVYNPFMGALVYIFPGPPSMALDTQTLLFFMGPGYEARISHHKQAATINPFLPCTHKVFSIICHTLLLFYIIRTISMSSRYKNKMGIQKRRIKIKISTKNQKNKNKNKKQQQNKTKKIINIINHPDEG